MQTYRQRQQRWAQEKVVEEKAELLTRFLEVVDNLEQALKHIDAGDPAYQGVQMAYDSLLRMLIREDVERIFAQGRVFDPEVHEAVAVVPATSQQGQDMRVVEVMAPGYRYKGRVLRPAKVVVAK
jgi:molecular chaperone GrpE